MKADGASCTALRKLSPPYFTGRDAWVHAGVLGSKLILVMASTMDLSRRTMPGWERENKEKS